MIFLLFAQQTLPINKVLYTLLYVFMRYKIFLYLLRTITYIFLELPYKAGVASDRIYPIF